MAVDVDIHISDIAIISALNTPGGAIFEWRDRMAHRIIERAVSASPSNHPDNARKKPRPQGPPGEFKISWGFDRLGSNGHRVRATMYNGSGHADIVEFGRPPTGGYEKFSWVDWPSYASAHGIRGKARLRFKAGSIHAVKHGTSGRTGEHILKRSTNSVMIPECGAAV